MDAPRIIQSLPQVGTVISTSRYVALKSWFLENSSYQGDVGGQVLDHGSRVYPEILVVIVMGEEVDGT